MSGFRYSVTVVTYWNAENDPVSEVFRTQAIAERDIINAGERLLGRQGVTLQEAMQAQWDRHGWKMTMQTVLVKERPEDWAA